MLNRKIDLKKAIIGTILIVLISSSLVWVLATPPTLTLNAYMGEQEYAYIIFKIGLTYYAKNGITGSMDYSGAVFNLVMQLAINNSKVGQIGANILIKNGDYYINAQILILGGIEIDGSGYGTNFIVANNQNGLRFIGSNSGISDFLIQTNNASSGILISSEVNVHFIKIQDVKTLYGHTAIKLIDDPEFWIINCFLNHPMVYGIYLETSANASNDKTTLGWIDKCYIYDGCSQNAIKILGHSGRQVDAVRITNTQIILVDGIAVRIDDAYGGINRLIDCDISNPVGSCLLINANSPNQVVEGGFYETAGNMGMEIFASECRILNARVYFAYRSGIKLISANNTLIQGCDVWENDQSVEGWSGISIDNSFNNQVMNNWCHRTSSSQVFGILESGISDYNMIIGDDTRMNVAGGIYISGVNTKVNLCWNNNVWIP
jgi:hypothetical protein